MDAEGATVPYPEVIEAYKQWWRDAAHNGARFRVQKGETFPGYQFGEPFAYVRLVEDDTTESLDFETVAMQLYFQGMGGVLCREGWSPDEKSNVDCLWLSFGAVVDYRMNGRLAHREPSTMGWHWPADKYRLTFSEPSFSDLLPFQRYVMKKSLEKSGMPDPRVVLITDHLGNKSLVFNLHTFFPNLEEAMQMSGFINAFLPTYYSHTVFTNDYDAAIYPLLPFEAESEEELREQLWYAEADLREAARLEAALDAEAVPTAAEKQWYEVALRPETRFQVNWDQIVYDEHGAPYVVVRMAGEGESGYTFRETALHVADNDAGAVLRPPDGDADGQMSAEAMDEAQLALGLGDLIDFLMSGRLQKRRLQSDGWLKPRNYFEGRFSEPDTRLLPVQSRRTIIDLLHDVGIAEPKVALQTLADGGRLLHFSGFEAVVPESR